MQVFNENGITYHPDSCEPLKNASRSGKIDLAAWGRYNYPGLRLEENVLSGLNSIGCWDAAIVQDWGLDWHRNEGIEISFLQTGSLPFELGDEQHLLHPQEFFITRPWQPHKLGAPFITIGRLHWLIIDVNVRHPHQEWEWPLWIILSNEDLTELTTFLRQDETHAWKANDDIKTCFQRIGKLLRANPPKNESLVKVYINEILINLLQLFRKGNIALNKSLIDGKRSIEIFVNELNDKVHEPWTISSMAGYCDMGVTRFIYYFKLITNKTPMQYLNFLRLNRAADMLISQPDKTIAEICYQCGFSGSEYFATLFRKTFKSTPSSFRLEKRTNE